MQTAIYIFCYRFKFGIAAKSKLQTGDVKVIEAWLPMGANLYDPWG